MDDAGPPHRPPRPALRPALVVCLVLSLALHGLLAGSWLWPRAGGLAAPAGAPSPRVSLRLAEPDAIKPVAGPPVSADALPPPPPPVAEDARAPEPATAPALAEAAVAARATPGVRAGDYVPAEWLDRKPAFLGDVEATLTPLMVNAGAGVVQVSLLVSSAGLVDEVLIERSDLGAEATRRFADGLRGLRLTPGVLGHNTVRSRWRLEFTFYPES